MQHDFWFVNVVSLHEMKTELEEDRHGIRILHAFRNRLDAPLARCGDDFTDRVLHRRIRRQRMHQLAVDLDVVRLEDIEYL